MIELVEGDAFDLLAEMPEDSADCAIVDYPWEFDDSNGTGRFDSEPYESEDNNKLRFIVEHISRVLRDGSWVFLFTNDKIYPKVRKYTQWFLDYRNTVIWDKKNWGLGTYHRIQHYPIVTATVGDTDRMLKDRGSVYRVKHTNTRLHKPPELYSKMIAPPVVRDGDKVIEPFCGTAPGAIAVRERDGDIDYWGCDIDGERFEKTQNRISTRSLIDDTE